MTPEPENVNYAFAGAFVDELARSGLRYACVCPGSRSTPLTISLARHLNIKTWVHLDERSCAFFALGMARALHEPVALLCTSGTAAANFFPAVIEANYAHAPLLVLTSDRPPELWEWGAPQTIDQSRLYGTHVKWSVNMTTPGATPDLLRYVRAVACRAFAISMESPEGPVQVNFPFREPLAPEVVPGDSSEETFSLAPEAWHGREGERAYIEVKGGIRIASDEVALSLSDSFKKAERGLIVCGPQDDPGFASGVSALAAKLGYPILADSLSQVRCGAHDRRLIIDSYDAFLRNDSLVATLLPEVVLRFGATPTSKVLLNYLQRHRQARQVVVSNGTWNDPIHAATDFIQVDPTRFTTDLTAAITDSHNTLWTQRWLDANAAASASIMRQLELIEELFEGKVFSELASIVPAKVCLFAGNSMPVRDLDGFFPSTDRQIRFMANRGVNGIDGVISSALGVSAALPDPLILVLGDISFYHDMNGLLAAKQNQLNATIIVVNNDGGGIFSFLPQADYPEFFERYLGTPHGLTFQQAAFLYDLGYSKVTSWKDFRDAVSESIRSMGTSIIEVPGDRKRNVELHRRMWAAVGQATTSSILKPT
ncbi:MAG: 2-succinyl-5-enolpyruvyl-6-hydroxy-3-cyclohexene-1-carboxylic-acid synthase [Chloroflexi bacterium]|nr:2-succinyl-5-enolpyruvyl-6-hydroxy-3-cyclohexene-1-carboxylic-acid synthase [Chloroflexota bacterium]